MLGRFVKSRRLLNLFLTDIISAKQMEWRAERKMKNIIGFKRKKGRKRV